MLPRALQMPMLCAAALSHVDVYGPTGTVLMLVTVTYVALKVMLMSLACTIAEGYDGILGPCCSI